MPVAVGLVLAWAAPAHAEREVPPERQALILGKALSYDAELKARVGDDIAVAVVSRTGHPRSEAMGTAMVNAFKRVQHVKIQGLGLTVRSIGYSTPVALSAAFDEKRVDVLYVCAALDSELPAITALSRKRKITTFGSSLAQVVAGLALGVFAVEDRPSIVLNLTAARSEGAAFSSELLRVAQVIRNESP